MKAERRTGFMLAWWWHAKCGDDVYVGCIDIAEEEVGKESREEVKHWFLKSMDGRLGNLSNDWEKVKQGSHVFSYDKHMELRRLVHVALEEKADYLLGGTASFQSLIVAITAIVSLKNLLFLNSPSQKKWFALCCRMEVLFFHICSLPRMWWTLAEYTQFESVVWSAYFSCSYSFAISPTVCCPQGLGLYGSSTMLECMHSAYWVLYFWSHHKLWIFQ